MLGTALMQVSHDVPDILQCTLMKTYPFQNDQKTRHSGTVDEAPGKSLRYIYGVEAISQHAAQQRDASVASGAKALISRSFAG